MIEEFDLDLGSMPSDWSVSDIQNETLFVTDYVANGSFASLAENVNYKNEPDYAVLIRLTDFNNDFKGDFVYVDEHAYKFLAKSKLVGGEIIISNVGAYAGTTFLAPRLDRPMTLGPNAIMMNFKSGNAFYFYWFKSPVGKFLLDGIISGSAQPKFNKTTFRQLKVPVPPIKEQKAIASVLSSLDDKIDLLHRQNTTLERMAETLFRQWFVEEAQEDWEDGTIEDLFILQRGYDLPIQNRTNGCYPIFAASGFSGGHVEYKVSAPGVTTGRSGILGKVFFVQENFWPLNTSLYIRGFKKGTPLFSYFVLKNIDLESFNAGSAVPTLNRNHVHDFSITIPPVDLIKNFESLMIPNFKKIDSNEKQIRTLEKLRDNLLPKLMSGELRINND